MGTGASPAREQPACEEDGAPASSPERLVYLYCVLQAGSEAVTLLRSGRIQGIDRKGPLYAIEAAGLVGAVSLVPGSLFAEEPLNELVGDLPRLAPFVLRHEEAIRALFSVGPAVVPMAFGAVYREEVGVARFLDLECKRLSALLEALRGKQEWGVKIFVEVAAAMRAAEAASAALHKLDDDAKAATPGRAYLLQRKREEMLTGEVRSFVADALESVVNELVPRSTDARLDEVPSNQQGPHELVLKAAFLVDEEGGEDFRAIAGQLIDRLTPIGLSMEVSGPWAPYSFTGERA